MNESVEKPPIELILCPVPYFDFESAPNAVDNSVDFVNLAKPKVVGRRHFEQAVGLQVECVDGVIVDPKLQKSAAKKQIYVWVV